MRWKYSFLGISFLFLFWMPLRAQHATESFGKNRIQYKPFEWQYLSSENFDLYYYDARRRVATETVQYLEGEFDRITDLIGYPPYMKTKVFLYNSIADMQQSNIGLNSDQYNVGGETEFIKPYVEIAHPGNLEDFKEELILKVSTLLVNEMMFGGSLKDMFQNAVLLNLPDWFIYGASRYVAKGWDAEMDDFVRQLVRNRKFSRALKMNGREAELVGQSIWNYIVEKYGKSSISNILNYTRVIRNEQKSVLITLGVSFKKLITDWQEYYLDINQKVENSYFSPSDSTRISPSHRKSVVFTTVKISPDGQNIAYAENDRGKFVVKVRPVNGDRETTILHGGNKVLRQDVDFQIPLISWAEPNVLGVIGVKQGRYVFWLYDLATKSKLPRELDQYSNIRSFDFSGNGRLAVLSADLGGQNDLFLISSRRDRTRRLTNDIYDDLDPAFIPNTNSIIFSSNRTNDTTNLMQRGYKEVTRNYNLFVHNLDTTENVVKRLTNTLSNDYYPQALDENNFYYLSDQRGIVNLFRYNRETGIYSQVTNYNSSIKEYDIDTYYKSFAFVMNKNLREDIFLVKNFNLDRQIFTPATRRVEVRQAKILTERRRQEIPQVRSIRELIDTRLRETEDTLKVEIPADTIRARVEVEIPASKDSINTDNYVFDELIKNESIPTLPSLDKIVKTDDYVFDDEVTKRNQPSESFLNRYMKARESTRLTGPFDYEPKFSYNNMVTDFVIDQLRGFSVRIETQMNDMLENYRFFGGVQTAFDLKSGDLYGEIQYLPHYIDYKVRFDRKVIFWEDGSSNLQKYSLQRFEAGASLPLNVKTRLTLVPFIAYTKYTDRGNNSSPASPPVFAPAEDEYYTGAKSELIYDNSLNTGMNIIEGTRGKVSFIHHEGLGNKSASFSQISLDIRHYQKIYKEIVFAVRGYMGSYFGNSPKNYVLGGMDNWFGSNLINYEGLNNPLYSEGGFNDQLIFTEFATSLRGFRYATLYGQSVALANAEFRIPIIRALAGGPITSNFFRNMQFTAFYDIGTSWTGAAPFSQENSVRLRIVPENPGGSPFRVELKEYLNPWLYSYGFGFRTMMLGYYMKFDLAWPVENYIVQNPRLSVTIGFDF